MVAGAENRPPMLEKLMYDSWESRIRLFIKGKKHGRMMLDSIDNGPLVYPTVEENGQTRPMKYSELTEVQQLQDDYDVQATNIILHGLPPDVYALVNHQQAAKDIWDRVKLLMKGTELSYQECEWRLYNFFDKFAYVQGETLHEYYWSKFVTDVKLAKSLYTTNYDQLYAYLSQHERHANEVRITHERYSDPLALQREYPIECINKAMAFLSVVASRFPPSNNQLRTSSNPRNQGTIQDGRVTVQQVQGRQTQSYAGIGNKGITTISKGNYATGQPREKFMLAKAQEVSQILDEEQLAFLADPGISEALDVQEMQYSEQTHIDDFQNNEIHSDSNIISYSQYLQESQDAVIQDTNSSAPNDLLVLSLVEQMTDHVAHLDKENQTNKMLYAFSGNHVERELIKEIEGELVNNTRRINHILEGELTTYQKAKDGRVTIQQVQGRQTQSYAGIGNKGITTISKENYATGQPRVVNIINCSRKGHMARTMTQPKGQGMYGNGIVQEKQYSGTNTFRRFSKIKRYIVIGEYSQWSEQFMNYLEEQTDEEAMINSIKNGGHPLLVTGEEKKTRKIDRLARSLLIQRLLNDIYSLIDSNDTAKDLWDALERQIRGSEYDEQDRKAVILYGYETFKTTEGEQLLDTYLRYLQVINDLKKCGYMKDNSLVAEKTKVSKRKEKVVVQSESEGSDDEDITSSSANKKLEYVKSEEKKEDKKADEKKWDMRKVKCYNCKKEGHFVKDYKKATVKDYNYCKTKMLLAKKDGDEQVLLAEDQA
ncbi:copia protein [Tanacetum coccineum]